MKATEIKVNEIKVNDAIEIDGYFRIINKIEREEFLTRLHYRKYIVEHGKFMDCVCTKNNNWVVYGYKRG